ncbi:hypothetical protein T01_7850 [Trichinella spiralis]|uniref:Uncharacterized protein n=1 Tax=Trichinella spiralis TaxID=6334 RepID=A0A0V0Z3P6_TRISP|nr:hypothetical protein T01_7850 [Trichinella spiralis]
MTNRYNGNLHRYKLADSQQKYCEETYCSRTVVVCSEMTNRHYG